MGLVQDKETGEYAVLSDILGDEDHLGDMDFKVTGTEKGICACQMDIKIQGLSNEILTAALHQARERPPAHSARDGQDHRCPGSRAEGAHPALAQDAD